eukprot:TRINITY_DN3340_c0_g1_i3.p1 TRINITY_DN3340_c0_g1~~TRINITY_DN3340_c0_g1_i3.p1  ORF type:complete len:475 (+),score=93.16 TRINITY_DN3340_c0_g1_i3:72-1427(+)
MAEELPEHVLELATELVRGLPPGFKARLEKGAPLLALHAPSFMKITQYDIVINAVVLKYLAQLLEDTGIPGVFVIANFILQVDHLLDGCVLRQSEHKPRLAEALELASLGKKLLQHTWNLTRRSSESRETHALQDRLEHIVTAWANRPPPQEPQQEAAPGTAQEEGDGGNTDDADPFDAISDTPPMQDDAVVLVDSASPHAEHDEAGSLEHALGEELEKAAADEHLALEDAPDTGLSAAGALTDCNIQEVLGGVAPGSDDSLAPAEGSDEEDKMVDELMAQYAPSDADVFDPPTKKARPATESIETAFVDVPKPRDAPAPADQSMIAAAFKRHGDFLSTQPIVNKNRVVPESLCTSVHEAYLRLPECCLPQAEPKGKYNFIVKSAKGSSFEVQLSHCTFFIKKARGQTMKRSEQFSPNVAWQTFDTITEALEEVAKRCKEEPDFMDGVDIE